MDSKVRSEDELGVKWDRCLSDTAIKVASGLGLGIVFSVLFFKTSPEFPGSIYTQRRPWPAVFGTGVGVGMGYANCQNDFNQGCYPRGFTKMIKEKLGEKPAS